VWNQQRLVDMVVAMRLVGAHPGSESKFKVVGPKGVVLDSGVDHFIQQFLVSK